MAAIQDTRKLWQPGTLYEFGEVVEPRYFTGFYYKAELVPLDPPPPPPPEGEEADPAPTAGRSAAKEPAWPASDGSTVVDGTERLRWRAFRLPSITWEAYPIFSTGFAQPVFPQTVGAEVADGDLTWICETPAVVDPRCPSSWVAVIGASKVFAPYADVVRFSAANNPLDWSGEQDSGFLPTGMQATGDPLVTAMGLYRGNLVAWTGSNMQVWQIDPDPQRMSVLDVIEGIGCRWPRSVSAMQSDLFFLSDSGVRSVSVAAGTGNLAAGDVGTPIDALIRAILATETDVDPIGLYAPGLGQYWLVFQHQAFVLTLSPAAQVVAWSRYTFPWPVEEAIVHLGTIVLRSGTSVFEVDPTATMDDDTGTGQPRKGIGVEIQWPWLDFGSPGADKVFTGFDTIASAPCAVSFGYDEFRIDRFTRAIAAPASSRGGGFLPLHCIAPSLSVRVAHNGAEPFELQQVTLYMQGGSGPQ